MPIVYEVPTHLNVSDTILFGLQPRQVLRMAVACSLAYLVWDQAPVLSPEMRIVVASLLASIGFVCALARPYGRPLDRWMLAVLLYLLLPRRLAWRRLQRTSRGPETDGSGWAELSPDLTWADLPTPTHAMLGRETRP